jgi:hypothetical protein
MGREVKSRLRITQNGCAFLGKSTVDTGFTSAGAEKVRGELDRNGLKKAGINRVDAGWVNAKVQFDKKCRMNRLVIDDRTCLKVVLDRAR